MSNIEFETKILNINEEKIKAILNDLWAVYIWTKNFRRYTYDFSPIDLNKWIRLRTDWNNTTLTIKEIKNDSFVRVWNCLGEIDTNNQ